MSNVLPLPVQNQIAVIALPGMMMCGCWMYWYAWQRAQALAVVAGPKPVLPFDPTLN